jgi:UDP-N-acetylglucosamine acyltransferase
MSLLITGISKGGTMIHPSAVVHSTARIGDEVDIGPDAIVQKDVWIGEGTKIGARVVIGEGTRIGKNCTFLEFAKIGELAEGSSRKRRKICLVMGDENVVQQCATLDRGTAGKTAIGDGNRFMSNSRVGHDCIVGNGVVLAVGATLSGNNIVGDYVILGGLVSVNESCRIGTYALVTATARVSRDIPPYMLASGTDAQLFGPNAAALRNHGFPEEKLKELERAYYLLFRAGLSLKQSIKKLAQEKLAQMPEIRQIIQFMQHPAV